MSGIRVTYSGLISFAVGITSVLTGTVFTLIVTRSLTTQEFGTWNLIGSVILYVVIAEPIISYWATREIARGVESGKTAIVTSGAFSIGGVGIYLVIAYFVSQAVKADTGIILFSSILIPTMFLNRTLTSINLAWKPQASSYGILCFETTKIPAGLILVYFLHMGLSGAIISTVISYLASIIVLLFYSKEKIVSKIKKEFIIKWIKRSWLSVYPGISNITYHVDVIVFSVITGSVIGLAFYSAASTIGNVVANSSLISQALYPKLLEGGKKEHLQENLMRFFYFALPLTALAIVFAKPALFALKPIYSSALLVVIFTTIRTFLYALQGLYNQAILGIEKIDINENSTFKEFIQSKLFFMPTLYLIQYSLYVVVLAVGLIVLKPIYNSELDQVIFWSIVSLGTQLPFTFYFHVYAKRHFKFTTNIKVLIKYLFSSIIAFGITYFLLEKFLHYDKSIFVFVPNVLLFAAFGTSIYLVLTYSIDLKTREFFHAIINELRQKK